jgi:glycosyltransferase involved in cell wall biosynthesis
MRIAFVIPTLDQSGAERQLTLLASGMAARGGDVRVIALDRGGPLAGELTAAGIKVDVLGKRFRLDPLALWRLRQSLRQFQPQIVQSFLFSANSYVRLPGIAPGGTKVVVSERCVDSWKSGWQLALDRRLVKRTYAMTANSHSVADFYAGVGVPRELITVIPNAIAEPADVMTREQARSLLGLDAHHKVVGFVGRLAPQKRLKDLLWTFQLLHQIVADAKLVLIGGGPERDRLAEIAVSFGCRDKIVLAGHRLDAYSLMPAFDAFALASEFEGMSNSLMEAMSLGIPCVVSDIPANRELVTHETTGLLSPLGECPAMTKALARVLNDQELAARLGEGGRRLMRERHGVDQMVDQYDELYRRLVG